MDLDIEPQVIPQAPVSGPPPWERLDPRYVTLERRTELLGSGIFAALLLALILVLSLAPRVAEYRMAALGLWALLMVPRLSWAYYRPILIYRHSSFRLDAEGIEIRRGIFFRRIISVPRSRVQHTDVAQGPFERHFGLGTLHIYTAGVSHAQVPLAGLSHGRAIEIRDALLPRDRST